MLSVQALSKNFGTLRALDRISLDVPRNTIAGIIGPNGAGKTTLLLGMAGLLPMDSGRLYWEDQFIPISDQLGRAQEHNRRNHRAERRWKDNPASWHGGPVADGQREALLGRSVHSDLGSAWTCPGTQSPESSGRTALERQPCFLAWRACCRWTAGGSIGKISSFRIAAAPRSSSMPRTQFGLMRSSQSNLSCVFMLRFLDASECLPKQLPTVYNFGSSCESAFPIFPRGQRSDF